MVIVKNCTISLIIDTLKHISRTISVYMVNITKTITFTSDAAALR